MGTLGQILQYVGGIGAFICFILVLVRIFQAGQTGLGIICLVTLFCCGIGHIVTFIVGWMHYRDWALYNIMLAWTICLVCSFIGYALAPAAIDPRAYFPT